MHCASQQASRNELSIVCPSCTPTPTTITQLMPRAFTRNTLSSRQSSHGPFPLASAVLSLLLHLPSPPQLPLTAPLGLTHSRAGSCRPLFSTCNTFLSYPTKHHGFKQDPPTHELQRPVSERPLPSTPEIAIERPTQVYLMSIPAIQILMFVLLSLPSLDGNCSTQTPKSQR